MIYQNQQDVEVDYLFHKHYFMDAGFRTTQMEISKE